MNNVLQELRCNNNWLGLWRTDGAACGWECAAKVLEAEIAEVPEKVRRGIPQALL